MTTVRLGDYEPATIPAAILEGTPPAQQFQHKLLNKERQEIRLLKFRHVSKSGRLKLTIDHVSLEEAAEKYDCISYEWGTGAAVHPVYIDKLPVLLRENAWRCILHICHSKIRSFKLGWFWIDYICINQTDAEEKGWQVALMSQIYSKAKKVLIWLGEASRQNYELKKTVANVIRNAALSNEWGDFEASQYLKKKSNHQHLLDSHIQVAVDRMLLRSKQLIQYSTGRPANIVQLMPRLILRVCGNGLHRFPDKARDRKIIDRALDDGYWQRLWIIQEIALTRQAFMVAGLALIDVQTLAIAQYHFEQQLESIHPFSRLRNQLQLLRVHMYRYDFDIVDLMFRFESHKCSDIRDKVFALLSMSKQRDVIEADYSSTHVDLFARVMLATDHLQLPWVQDISTVNKLMRIFDVQPKTIAQASYACYAISSSPHLFRDRRMYLQMDHLYILVSCEARIDLKPDIHRLGHLDPSHYDIQFSGYQTCLSSRCGAWNGINIPESFLARDNTASQRQELRPGVCGTLWYCLSLQWGLAFVMMSDGNRFKMKACIPHRKNCLSVPEDIWTWSEFADEAWPPFQITMHTDGHNYDPPHRFFLQCSVADLVHFADVSFGKPADVWQEWPSEQQILDHGSPERFSPIHYNSKDPLVPWFVPPLEPV